VHSDIPLEGQRAHHVVDAGAQRGDVVGLDGREHGDAQLVAAELAVGLGVDDAVGPQHRATAAASTASTKSMVPTTWLRSGVLHERPGEVGLLGPGVEDLGRAVAAPGRPLEAAVGEHPVELLGQQKMVASAGVL
jgi:hypothetical protein